MNLFNNNILHIREDTYVTDAIWSTRPVIKLRCASCNITIHEGTTAPELRWQEHIKGESSNERSNTKTH